MLIALNGGLKLLRNYTAFKQKLILADRDGFDLIGINEHIETVIPTNADGIPFSLVVLVIKSALVDINHTGSLFAVCFNALDVSSLALGHYFDNFLNIHFPFVARRRGQRHIRAALI